jgi:hypothetical protein
VNANDKKLVAVGLIVICAVAIAFAVVYSGVLQTQSIIDDDDDDQTVNEYTVSLPTKFTLMDDWAGSVVQSATVNLYRYSDFEPIETSVTEATGVYTTSVALMSGERVWVECTKSNALYYYDVTIPKAGSTGQTNHYVTVPFYAFGTFTISAYWPNGTAVPSASTPQGNSSVAVSSNGVGSYPSMTIMLRNTGDNTGTKDFYDPKYEWNRETLFYFVVTGTSSNQLIVKSHPQIYSAGPTTRYFGELIDPDTIVRDLAADGTIKSDGINSFTVSFDLSAMSAGGGHTWTVTLHLDLFSNLARFEDYGSVTGAYTSVTTLDFAFID